MGSGCYDIRIRYGRGMHVSGNQSGKMRHVHHMFRSHHVRNAAKPVEIDNPWIRAGSGYDELRPVFEGKAFHLLVVKDLSFTVYTVGDNIIELSGEVDRTVYPAGEGIAYCD